MRNFLFELSMVHLILISAYWLILKNEQEYGKLRFYLIGSALISLVIPLLKFPKLISNTSEVLMTPVPNTVSTGAISITPIISQPFWTDQLLLGIYLSITGIFICKIFYNIFYLVYLERTSHLEQFKGHKIRRVNRLEGSFTFFNWIFLNDAIDKKQQDYEIILKHEEAHSSLGHSFDLLLFELYTACFWWLPSAWIVQKEIKKIHEYQADAYALKSYDINQYSSILISSTLKTNGLSMANSFHDGLIFKRLNAMKQQTKKVSRWKVGALSTICLMLISIFSCSEEKLHAQDASDETRETFNIVETQPSYEGGMDAFYSYAKNEIKYPEGARKESVEGEVFVQFTIERNGSLSDVKVMNDIGGGCGQEAVRVVNNATSFKAGSQRGRTVKTKMILPVTFALQTGKTNADKSPQGSVIIGQLQMSEQRLQLDVKYNDDAWVGTIKSEEGKPLPGANIVVEGTSYGRVSDLDGSFSVKATNSQSIHISYVGYESIRLEGQKK